MKKYDVEIAGMYTAKVSGAIQTVRIIRANPAGGWDATNVRTGRAVRIRSAQRLRTIVWSPEQSVARAAAEDQRVEAALRTADVPAGNPRERAYLRMADAAHARGEHDLGNHWARRASQVAS